MIAVAKCRTGFVCRYHGRSVISPAIVKKIKTLPHVLICPEMAAGLSVPRPPIRKKDKKYLLNGAIDITADLKKCCTQIAKELAAAKVSYFIGVKDSPCCDPTTGLFALALQAKGIPTTLSVKEKA